MLFIWCWISISVISHELHHLCDINNIEFIQLSPVLITQPKPHSSVWRQFDIHQWPSIMDKWEGKVAVVTGASSGIGRAIAHVLVSHGVTVVGIGRNPLALKKVADHCKNKKGKFYPKVIDINDELQVVSLFRRIHLKLGGVHILINSAAIFLDSSLIGGKHAAWTAVLQPQLVGLSICSREAIRSMKHSLNEGVIININRYLLVGVLGLPRRLHVANDNRGMTASYIRDIVQFWVAAQDKDKQKDTGGHYIPAFPMPPMMTVAKHGVTVLTEILRRELAGQKLRIRVTSLSPGLVKTEKVEAIAELKNKPLLELKDVTDAVVFVLSSPSHLDISELTLRAHGSNF